MVEYNVYSITCKSTGFAYIGRSQEIEKRWRSHRNMLRRGTHSNTIFQMDWTTYGEEDFDFSILHTYDNLDNAERKEQELIDSTVHKYNISDAGDGGDTFTNNPRQEEIRKMKSYNSSGERNPMYGKPKSEFTIRRIKEANSKPILIDGVHYSSVREASRALGVGVTTICYRLKAESDQFTNWKYAN